jgi:uncharacterized oligopeptide transporter (OPT) family protein
MVGVSSSVPNELPQRRTLVYHGPMPELTPRAVVTGAALGVLLAIANVYMGLKTGWWETGTVTASVLGFAVLSVFRRRPSTPLETNAAQSLATATGAVPAAAGLVAAIPALALLGRAPPGWAVALLGLGAGLLGVVLAHALRRRLLEDEALPFPSGLAAAEVIAAAHADRGGWQGGRALAASAAASAAAAWLRNGWPRLLPDAFLLPGALGGVPAATLGLGVSVSPMLLGAGALVGPRNGLSVLAGALLAWAAVAPATVRAGLVAGGGYGELAAWLLWPGTAIMIGASVAALGADLRAFRGGLSDLSAAWRDRAGAPARLGALLALAAAAVLVVAGALGFGLHPAETAVALAATLVATAACARAAGRADIAPAGELGQIVQAGHGAAAPARAAQGIAAGAIPAGVAVHASVVLWSLQVGRRLGASPVLQARAQLLGVALGSIVAVPVYELLVGAYGLGSAALPVPYAERWRALADVIAGGAGALPRGAAAAALAAVAVGLALELAGRAAAGGRRRFLPSPAALGLGFVIPAHAAVAIALGAVAAAWASRRWPAGAARNLHATAAGAIAGESVGALAVAILVAAGALSVR